jgi:hypothetical protein
MRVSLEAAVRGGRRRSIEASAAWEGTGSCRVERASAAGSGGIERRESTIWRAKDQCSAGTIPGDRGQSDRSAADPARGRTAAGARAGKGAGAAGDALRAGGAEPALAIGHLHLSLAAARAGVPHGVHGRPLALRGRVGAVAAAEISAGDGSIAEGGGEVRGAAGSADRPGPAVHRLARDDGIRGGAEAKRNPPPQEPAASSADAWEGRALLEDLVGGISLPDGVCGLRGLPEAAGALHRRVQLPAAAPGDWEPLAGGSVLPGGRARARGSERAGEGQCIAIGEAAAGDQAVLLGGEAGGRRPEHCSGPRRAAHPARRRGSADDSLAEGSG